MFHRRDLDETIHRPASALTTYKQHRGGAAQARTRLSLEHSGFLRKNAFAFEMMGKGWREKILQTIGEVTATLD